jgi:prepilin-type N-terminal cleavage/methylation domain-containing protein
VKKMKSGMTLVELLVAMTIIIIVVGIVYSLYSYSFTQAMFFDQHWPGQSAAQFSAFMITKYLHNASTAKATTTYNTPGNYIILSKGSLCQRIVSNNKINTVSTSVIAKNIQSVSFQATSTTSSPPSLYVTVKIAGTGSATLTTTIFLNNSSVQNTVSTNSSTGTVLFSQTMHFGCKNS